VSLKGIIILYYFDMQVSVSALQIGRIEFRPSRDLNSSESTHSIA